MVKRIKINSMKGLSPLISMVLVIGFGVAAMTIVLTVVNPMLDRAKDSAIVNEATQNMLLLDSAIKAVASESEGSKRTVNIKITEGVLRTNRSSEWVYTEFDPKSNYEIDGFTGDIKLTSRPNFLEYFNQYTEGGSATQWASSNGTWSVDTNRYRGIGGVAYYVLGNISDFEYTGSIAPSVEPEGQIFLLPVNPKNLVLFLPFDGNRNYTHRTAFDYSGYGMNASLQNITSATCFSNNACPNWTDAGRFGNATEFDGLGDVVNVTSSTGATPLNITTGNITVACWVRRSNTTALATLSHICQKANAYGLYFGNISGNNNFDRFSFNIFQSGSWRSLANTADTTNTDWHFVAGTYDGSTMTLYVDGSIQATWSTTGNIDSNSSGPFTVGANFSGSSPFNGTIDEVMVFNRSLAEPDLDFLYETSREKITAGGKQIQHIAEDANTTIVLSSPGTSFFDNIKVKKGEPKVRFLVPYDRIDIKEDARFGPGDHAIIIQNDGVNASNNNRPIIVLRE